MARPQVRIGFVSTRFAGTDGVSLETAKWAEALERLGHTCFYFSGECDRPDGVSYVVPEAHFEYPEIMALTLDLFDDRQRTPDTSALVQTLKVLLKDHLRRFISQFQVNLLIVENALALPMNVPLGMALAELIAETNLPTIAHHHDFSWERERFAMNAASDYLHAAFPPTLHSIHHVVINSFAARQLAMRNGVSSVLVPNVMDFDHPPPPADAHTKRFREAMGVMPYEVLLLQPTRIVPRKRIEKAVEITRRLDRPAVLVISHSAGDEGIAYENYLRELALLLGARVIFASEYVGHSRGEGKNGDAQFSLGDAYHEADLVTYPSVIEGFGNAFLETVYYRRPIMMASYDIFNVDIKPKGFRAITFGEFVDEACLQQAREWLGNPALVAEIVETNYQIAKRYYGYHVLEKHLALLLNECLGA
ncbi:MAG TPA: glycosyltransferase family 4 protein [Candidatus Limnocylindrales bacterium]|nr:glycosyltransferase family 4 protein [Candidatus Limnocylindrales bacterium]